MARDSEEIRSEERVRHKCSIRSADQHIPERDRAKDVEQFDDILRTFINDTNKFENRFCTVRDDDKMLAVKESMLEILLNYRFRGTTMSYRSPDCQEQES